MNDRDSGMTDAERSEAATASEPRHLRRDADGADDGGSVQVLAERQADDFRSRWDGVQSNFVDRPRDAVEQADALVGDVLAEVSRVFRDQRSDLEQRWADDAESTEDLRVALQRYREFFNRLLTI
jgi:hypothetical protein